MIKYLCLVAFVTVSSTLNWTSGAPTNSKEDISTRIRFFDFPQADQNYGQVPHVLSHKNGYGFYGSESGYGKPVSYGKYNSFKKRPPAIIISRPHSTGANRYPPPAFNGCEKCAGDNSNSGYVPQYPYYENPRPGFGAYGSKPSGYGGRPSGFGGSSSSNSQASAQSFANGSDAFSGASSNASSQSGGDNSGSSSSASAQSFSGGSGGFSGSASQASASSSSFGSSFGSGFGSGFNKPWIGSSYQGR